MGFKKVYHEKTKIKKYNIILNIHVSANGKEICKKKTIDLYSHKYQRTLHVRNSNITATVTLNKQVAR